MRSFGLMLPMTVTDMMLLSMFGGGRLLGDIGGKDDTAEITEEERLEVESHMSGLFNR